MVKPSVTITLGRSRQRVVKDSRGDSNYSRDNPLRSGSKRLLDGSFTSRADHAFKPNRKKLKNGASVSSYGNNRHKNDSRLGSEDLRLKLMRKRHSRDVKFEIEERRKRELHEKVSRAIRSADAPKESVLRNVTSSRGATKPIQKDPIGSCYAYRTSATEPIQKDPIESFYAYRTSTEVRTRSPDRVPRLTNGIPIPRSANDEMPRVAPSLMPIDGSRTRRFVMSDPLESSRPRVTLPSSSGGAVDPGKLVMQIPPATGGMSSSLYPDNQPLTVGGLLNSLGLGKYAINFRAEEIDMVALRQMGERDLKDLGIPMGPRKKILLALEARMKRQVAQARSNYM